MHRQFDRTLESCLDLQAAPAPSKKRANGLALVVLALLVWYGVDAKARQDAASKSKGHKKPPVAAMPR